MSVVVTNTLTKSNLGETGLISERKYRSQFMIETDKAGTPKAGLLVFPYSLLSS